jgi:hypothetical protein
VCLNDVIGDNNIYLIKKKYIREAKKNMQLSMHFMR